MEKLNRVEYLSKLKPTNSFKSILYNKNRNDFPVFEIDLKYLSYNPYNGRILSLTKSYEKQYGKLDTSNDKHIKLIEDFLWNSSPENNSHTLESLKKYGQNEIGIVTRDGIIIDGNRRASLLKILNEDGMERKFLSIILPDELEDNKKEINKLETIYQIGVDDKVDYNPIEKYLTCKELLTYYNVEEISSMMAEKPYKIQTYLDILKLMEEYLEYLEYEGVYTQLYKREGHFVDLNNYLNSYYKGSARVYVDWDYSELDIKLMKKIYFDYIRLGYPVSQCRIIARPSKSNSFFCFQNIWEGFSNEINKLKRDFKELSLIEFKKVNGGTNIESVIKDKDQTWFEKVNEKYILSLEFNSRILEDKKDSAAPSELLRRVKGTLGQIDVRHITDNNFQEVDNLIKEINIQIETIVKKITHLDKGNKS